jgi:hypothetical protein
MMTPDEVARLAALANALRPDWPAASIRTYIARHLAHVRAYGDTAVALAWIATKTHTETPRLLLEAGPWWQAALSDGQTAPRREPWDRQVACDVCERTADRHGPTAGHAFESRHDADRRRAHDTPKPPLRGESKERR